MSFWSWVTRKLWENGLAKRSEIENLVSRDDLVFDVSELDIDRKYIFALRGSVDDADAVRFVQSCKDIGIDAVLVSDIKRLRILEFGDVEMST